MRVAVIGGTGQVGRRLVDRLSERGLRVVVVSRHPADPLERREGVEYRVDDIARPHDLVSALRGCDVLVDVSDGKTRRAAHNTLELGSSNVARAAANAGVRRVVLLSIVGIDASDLNYYRAKRRQERGYLGAGLPQVAVQRATQFHTLVDSMHRLLARIGVIVYLKGGRFQSIDVDAVVDRLAELVENDATGYQREIAGPEVISATSLARAYLEASGRRGMLLGISLPGAAGRAFTRGGNIPDAPQTLGRTYREHLRSR